MGMSSQNDEVTRRMLVLLDLLAAAATDDNVFLSIETERCRSDLSKDALAKLPEGPQEWDTAFEALTQQLKDSLYETPEREEIEEAQPARVTYYKPRSSMGKRHTRRASAAVSNTVPDTKPPESPKRDKTVEPPPPMEEKEEEEEVDRRSQLEQQLSQMSYPKIGPGYSDSISVVSDLSTPTVMTDWEIPEEEHYGPPLQIGIRQPSVGSNQMVPLPPERDDESSRCLEEGSKLVRPPSQRVVVAQQPRRGAAAQRLQNRQAVLAHLNQAAAAGSSSPANDDRTKQHFSKQNDTTKLTVNDFSSLNYPTDEPSEYAAMRKPIHNGRRSLLRKSNKYAASVTATSTRLLLHSNAQKQRQTKRYGLTTTSRNNNRGQAAAAAATPMETLVPPPKQVDVDGVLTTMNCDIDFIFQELSVLDNEPFARDLADDDESNIGSTAKIKYTLGSVARTLRNDGTSSSPNKHHDALKNHDSLLDSQKNVWGGTIKEQQLSLSSARSNNDPLLIDEDGFIVSSNDNDTNGNFCDPFAPSQEDLFAPTCSKNENPFAHAFFPVAKRDTKRKVKRRPTAESSSSSSFQPQQQVEAVPKSNTVISSNDSNRESRIDAVEMATKKRIEMLRKLVEYRARTMSPSEDSGTSRDELQKLNFVEAETMKQIARLRERLGESRRQFESV